jgi:hypothetical protein
MAHLNISKFFNNEASTLIEARRKCVDIHGSDIRAAGNEVEIAVREWLQRMLPDDVSVGHGHIIDHKSAISPQLDCILRDRSHIPTLFTAADGTEYTPIDSVFAYGEIKSTYYKASKYIQNFTETKKRIKEDLEHALIKNTVKDGIKSDSLLYHMFLGSSQPYLNQIFTFMLFIDSGDASTEEITEIYSTTDDSLLPDIAVYLNGCVVTKASIEGDRLRIYKYSSGAPPEVGWKILPAPRIEGTDVTIEGKHLGFLYYCLLNHIKESALEGPNLTAYLKVLLVGSKSAMISIDPQQPCVGDGEEHAAPNT